VTFFYSFGWYCCRVKNILAVFCGLYKLYSAIFFNHGPLLSAPFGCTLLVQGVQIMPETAIERLIRQTGGQVALQQSLWRQEGVRVTQQAVSLWKTQGYAPRDRHEPLARVLSDGHEELRESWLIALEQDVHIAALNKSAGA
jgi:hypothetical protein